MAAYHFVGSSVLWKTTSRENEIVLSQLKAAYLAIRLFLANEIVAHIPSSLRLLFYRTVMPARIGEDSSIFMNVWFDAPRSLTIGTCSTVNQRCRLDSRGGITIGNNVSISAEVCILTAGHDVQSSDTLHRW